MASFSQHCPIQKWVAVGGGLAALLALDASPSAAGTWDAQLDSDQADSRFGYSVALADVDGDGHDDAIVGAQRYGVGEPLEGAAFVFLGSPSGIPNTPAHLADARLEGNEASAFFGTIVASAGDVDADGYDDLLVSARTHDGNAGGAVCLFRGGAGGIADGDPSTAEV